MNGKKKRILWIIGIVIILTLCLALFLKKETLEVETARAIKGDISEFIIEDGKTMLYREYEITSPLNGRIFALKLREGDTVKKGEIIAEIDTFTKNQELEGLKQKLEEINSMIESVDINRTKPEDIDSSRLKIEEIELQLKQLEKQKQINEINFKQQKTNIERQKKLLGQNVINQSLFEEYENSFKVSEKQLQSILIQEKSLQKNLEISRLTLKKLITTREDNEYQRRVYLSQEKQIQAQIRIIYDDLQRTRIKSPVSGTVLNIYTKDEMAVAAGTRLFKLGDIDSIMVEADILSEEINQVKKGQKVEISGKSLNYKKTFGEVFRIFPSGFTKISSLGVEQQRVKVLIRFNNREFNLLPGTSVDVNIIIREKSNTVVIPERGLFKEKNDWFVFTVEGNKAQLRKVKIGLKNDENAEILEGLQEGEELVTEISNSIKPGINIISKK